MILGTMFFVTMTIFRFPYAMLVGVLIAFTALIPVFGAFIGCAVSFILIFLISPVQALLFLILFFVLQQIEGNLIYPHVVEAPGTSFCVGADGSYHRRKSYGSCGHADIYPAGISTLCAVP